MTGPQTLGRPIARRSGDSLDGGALIAGYYQDNRTDLLAHTLPIGMGNGGTAAVANELVFWRIVPVENVVITAATVLLDAGVASGELRVGIYTSGSDGFPEALVVDSGAIVATSSGLKTASFSAVRLFGNTAYWGCYLANSATITARRQTWNYANTQAAQMFVGHGTASPSTAIQGPTVAYTYAALPATCPAGAAYTSTAGRVAVAVAWTTRVP